MFFDTVTPELAGKAQSRNDIAGPVPDGRSNTCAAEGMLPVFGAVSNAPAAVDLGQQRVRRGYGVVCIGLHSVSLQQRRDLIIGHCGE